MSSSSARILLSRAAFQAGGVRVGFVGHQAVRSFASAEGLPESLKRVGAPTVFPDEYPGHDYDFNWCLNADGVTPLKKAAFRITKPLDLKLAGLKQHKTTPLKVNAASAKAAVPEAGSDQLTFETFDEVCQRTKDLLSLSDKLFCPEGYIPDSRRGVRIICNSATLAPKLLAYLDRAPRRHPGNLPITAFVLEGTEEDFSGYIIEEIDQPVTTPEGNTREEPTSIAAIVVVGKSPKLERVVAGIELCAEGLLSDEMERAANAEAKES